MNLPRGVSVLIKNRNNRKTLHIVGYWQSAPYRQERKQFSVLRYGFDEALRKALQFSKKGPVARDSLERVR